LHETYNLELIKRQGLVFIVYEICDLVSQATLRKQCFFRFEQWWNGSHEARQHVVVSYLALNDNIGLCKQEPMVDAVIAEDDHTYSLVAIQQWFDKGKRTSPMTNLEIGTYLRPNMAIRHMVEAILPHLERGFV